MNWPFRKKLHVADQLTRGSTNHLQDSFYFSRPQIEKPIIEALAQGDNLVIYGPSHQGKTTLLSRHLAPSDSIYIECRPGFKRTRIYRVALSSLGYSVMVEKTKRGKATTTVKFGVAWTGAEASAEGELEQTMQSITIDLKNPSEVAHMISRIKHLPWIVLNNFQLLDSATKKNILFDLTFFAERPDSRIIIVGAWSNEDYLEEIEPAMAGKFRYALVPDWSDEELRKAVAQWSERSQVLDAITPHLDDYLSLADGDISLFRAVVGACIDKGGSTPGNTAATSDELTQSLVLGRFRRGLSSKLKATFAEREIYLTYYCLQQISRFANNPKFHPIPNMPESDYIKTIIDPYTNRAYTNGRQVLLDGDRNPQYIEETTGQVVQKQTEIASFLLRKFHSAVHQGSSKIELARLVQEFGEQLLPKPISLDQFRLKAVFTRFDEVQRWALIVPPILAMNSERNAIEIVDRRLFLFLSSVTLDDLEELLDNVQPRIIPTARRRNLVSVEMTNDEMAAYVEKGMTQVPSSDEPSEREQDETEEDESGSNKETEKDDQG
jgi:hypothetical protein